MDEYKIALDRYLKAYFDRFGDKPHSGDDLRMFFRDSEYYKPEFEVFTNTFIFKSMLTQLGYKQTNKSCGKLGKWSK